MKKYTLSLLLLTAVLHSVLNAQNPVVDSLWRLVRAEKLDTQKVNLLNDIAWRLKGSDPSEARKVARKAQSIAMKYKFTRGESAAVSNIAVSFQLEGNQDSALFYYEKALLAREKMKDLSGISKLRNNMGVLFKTAGELDKAIEMYQQSLSISKKIGDKVTIANTLDNIAIIENQKGNLENALALFLESMKLREQINNLEGLSGSYLNIGMVLLDKKDFEGALEYQKKGLAIHEKLHDDLFIADSYNSIANIFFTQGIIDSAKHYYHKSIDLKKSLDLDQDNAIAYQNMGILLEQEKKFDESVRMNLMALEYFTANEEMMGIALVNNNLASVYAKTKNTKAAAAHVEKAYQIGRKLQSKSIVSDNYRVRSEIAEAQGHFKEALSYFQLYKELKDSVYNEENAKQIAEMKTKYESEKKEQQIKMLNIESEKERTLAEEKSRKQNVVIVSVSAILLLVAAFAFFVFRSLRITRKQKLIIEQQKEEVEVQRSLAVERLVLAEEQREIIAHQKKEVEEKQKEILDSILYARRIQTALLPTNYYVDKHLKRLNSNFNPET